MSNSIDDINDETEMIFDETGQIKFATLNALVTYLTTESNDKKNKDINTNFDKIFMHTFKLYCEPLVFLELLIQRVQSNNPDSNELMVKLKIHDIIKIWLLNHCDKEDEQDEICLKRLTTFINDDVSESDKDIYEDLLTIIDKIGTKNLYEINFDERTISTFSTTSSPLPIIPKNLKKLTILDIDPLEMARQLTILESKLFKKIMLGEFLTKNRENAKNIKELIKKTNHTSKWIIESTLNQTKNRARSLVIKHFINVANECRNLNNFSSMVGIISGLTSFEVFRLKNSGWNALNGERELMRTFDSMKKLISPSKNYQEYRSHLNNIRPPLVPFLGNK
nr:15587_t:CDS:2 [Entrophospora candida]